MKVQKLVGDLIEKKGIPPYALFWWTFNIAASMAAQFNPKILPYFKLIMDEMYKEHYGEAAVRLGLVKAEKEAEKEEVKNGLSDKPESDRQEPDVPESPPSSGIIIPE